MACDTFCNNCGNCSCTCENTLGCLDIYQTSCITYNGLTLACLGIDTNQTLNDLLGAINTQLCDYINNKGKVRTDDSDTVPKSLIDKLEAGANIILTGTGAGSNKKIRIDAVLGGQQIDEQVKVSPTDTVSGYLEGKIVPGECIIIQKVNSGFNEQLRVVIDWPCVLGKLTSLSGWCNAVTTCVGDIITSCPSISLNSPAISGNNVTLTWVSDAVNFNVYQDGILLPGMPTSSHTYNLTGLSDGNHTLQVSALCTNGSSNSATTNVVINSACPSASALTVSITAGTGSLTWVPGSGPNTTDQMVQYKLRTASTWTTAATVSTSTSTRNINGLLPNEIYDFRIVTDCSIGGPTASPVISAVQITCPTVTLTASNTSIGYSFTNVGGRVNQYIVELLNNTGSLILQTKTESAPFAATITNSFTGLVEATNYQVRITVVAQEFTKVCAPQAISTSTTPACPAPTGIAGTTS